MKVRETELSTEDSVNPTVPSYLDFSLLLPYIHNAQFKCKCSFFPCSPKYLELFFHQGQANSIASKAPFLQFCQGPLGKSVMCYLFIDLEKLS